MVFSYYNGLTNGLVCSSVIGVRCSICHIVYDIFGTIYHTVHTVHDAVSYILDCITRTIYGIVYDITIVDIAIVQSAVVGGSIIGVSVGGSITVVVGGILGVRRVAGTAVVIGIATGNGCQHQGEKQQSCCVFSELFHNMNSPFCRLWTGLFSIHIMSDF